MASGFGDEWIVNSEEEQDLLTQSLQIQKKSLDWPMGAISTTL